MTRLISSERKSAEEIQKQLYHNVIELIGQLEFQNDPEVKKIVRKIKKSVLKMSFVKEEYKKRKVVPTRLTYEDHYPVSTEYITPDSIKFLREFDFKKKKRDRNKIQRPARKSFKERRREKFIEEKIK